MQGLWQCMPVLNFVFPPGVARWGGKFHPGALDSDNKGC